MRTVMLPVGHGGGGDVTFATSQTELALRTVRMLEHEGRSSAEITRLAAELLVAQGTGDLARWSLAHTRLAEAIG